MRELQELWSFAAEPSFWEELVAEMAEAKGGGAGALVSLAVGGSGALPHSERLSRLGPRGARGSSGSWQVPLMYAHVRGCKKRTAEGYFATLR